MELVSNLLQFIVTLLGFSLSGIRYLKSRKQAYFLLRPGPGVKFCVSDIRQKSRMALENRANSGLNPLFTESHGGQSGMRAGTA